MYDLRFGPADVPEVAVECVGAVDRIRTETWNVVPAKGPLELALRGAWSITLTPSAQVKAIRKSITGFQDHPLQRLHRSSLDPLVAPPSQRGGRA